MTSGKRHDLQAIFGKGCVEDGFAASLSSSPLPPTLHAVGGESRLLLLFVSVFVLLVVVCCWTYHLAGALRSYGTWRLVLRVKFAIGRAQEDCLVASKDVAKSRRLAQLPAKVLLIFYHKGHATGLSPKGYWTSNVAPGRNCRQSLNSCSKVR